MASSGGNRIKFGIDFQVNKSGIQQVKKSLQEIQNIKPLDVSISATKLRDIQKEAKKVEQALTAAFSVKLNTLNMQTFNAKLKQSKTNLDQFYQKVSQLGATGRASFNNLATSLTTTNTHLRQSAGLLQQMGTTMLNTVKWGIASSVMNTFTSSVQQAFQYVKSLDSALSEF